MKLKLRTKMIAVFVLWCMMPLGVHAQTWNVPVYGCLAGKSATAQIPQTQVAVRTGHEPLDNAMVEDITELDNAFGVSVPVYFLVNQSQNAFFTPTKFPDLIRADGANPDMIVTGSVFFGAGLLISEFKATNGSLMSVPAIMAHEFAHAMQYKNSFPYAGKWRELHADYIAGWYIGHRGRYRPQNALQAFLNFYYKGDYDFFDKGHHGTPQERAAAFNAGFNLNVGRNEASAVNAYNAGLRYVTGR